MKALKITFFIIIGGLIFMTYLIFTGKISPHIEYGNGYHSYETGISYIKSKRLKNFSLLDIKSGAYNNKYIIAVRNIGTEYDCDFGGKTEFLDKLEYIIIDKTTDKVLATDEKEKFINMKSNLGINLEFHLDYNEINKLLEKDKKKISISNITKDCKEAYPYPLIKY
jgi:hypothetical protein